MNDQQKILQLFKHFTHFTWVKSEDSVESVEIVVRKQQHYSYFHLKDILLLQYINYSNQFLKK